MKKGVQQIMLGTVTGTYDRALSVLERIRNAGYDGVELNRYMIHPTPLFVRALTRVFGMPTGGGGKLDWKSLVKESGLEVISLHTDLGTLEKDPRMIADEALSLGTRRVVITGVYNYDYTKAESVKALSRRLNDQGRILSESGVSLFYHNHNTELITADDGRKAYDIILEETNPDAVSFEFDSYWFTDGGADAAFWMRKLGKRMKLWHVTDRGIRHSGASVTPILKADSMELGKGSMNLEALHSIAEANGIEAVVLESHRNWIDKDPVLSLEVSGKYLEAW